MKKTDNSKSHQFSLLPWNGEVLAAEAAKPGGRLMGAIMACAAQRGHAMEQLGKQLGVTHGYVSQLRSGFRRVDNISMTFARACAAYLGTSPVKVMLMSGKLMEDDFEDPAEDKRKRLAAALDAIYQDERWRHFITDSLKQADEKTQLAVVRMFEAATNSQLLPAMATC